MQYNGSNSLTQDQQVVMVSSTTHQIHPTIEMHQCASHVVNKATWEMSVRVKEFFTPTARMPATTTGHAENSQITHPAQPTATFQWVTTQQPHCHHYQEVHQTQEHKKHWCYKMPSPRSDLAEQDKVPTSFLPTNLTTRHMNRSSLLAFNWNVLYQE